MIGVPLGRVVRKKSKGVVICCDPLSWFERGDLISQPSAFVLGLPALGKSTLIRRIILGLDYQGVKTMVLGDLKGEYVDEIRALGGQVIPVGRGRGYINILDMEDALKAVDQLRAAGKDDLADRLLAEAKNRRQASLEILLTIHRSASVSSRESTIISAALAELDSRIKRGVPVLSWLLQILQNPTAKLHEVALSRGDMARYQEITESLESDLTALSQGHGLGEIFSQPTSVRMKRGEHVVFDVSSIGDSDSKMQAAALMLCWEIGFEQIAIGNALADAGLEAQQTINVVMDELWRALRAGPGLVNRADNTTRLNRDKGISIIFASHTMDDLKALPTEDDRKKAAGMVERCGIVIAFGLPASEMPRLSSAVRLSDAEIKILQSWTTPLSWSTKKRKRRPPPGRGKCLIKVGDRRGIAIHIDLTDVELPFSQTSKRFAA
jgi:hypothetical protein